MSLKCQRTLFELNEPVTKKRRTEPDDDTDLSSDCGGDELDDESSNCSEPQPVMSDTEQLHIGSSVHSCSPGTKDKN